MKPQQQALTWIVDGILKMAKFFREELIQKRNVALEYLDKSEQTIAWGDNFFEKKDKIYIFKLFSTYNDIQDYCILVSLDTYGNAALRFQWKQADSVRYRYCLLTKSFPNNKLSDSNLLDLMARFLKREIPYRQIRKILSKDLISKGLCYPI